MNKIKTSFFQLLPNFNDVEFNVKQIENILDKNKEEILKSNLVVFPEYSFSGPLNLDSFKSYLVQLDEIDLISRLKEISLNYPKVTFVFGSAILKDADSDKYKNTTFVIKNKKVIIRYSKKALIYNENHLCKSDNEYPIFEVEGKKVGLAICWDTILPEVFRKYVGKVDLVVVPSFWGAGGNALQSKYSFSLEKKYYSSLCIARCYENSFAILFVNSVGKYTSPHYSDRMMGGSLAIMPPLGETYKTNNKKHEFLHQVEFNFDELDKYREFYATDKDFEYYKSKEIF
jgi:predicted amidohydrolase